MIDLALIVAVSLAAGAAGWRTRRRVNRFARYHWQRYPTPGERLRDRPRARHDPPYGAR